MNRRIKLIAACQSNRYSAPVRRSDEMIVQNGLAVTPSEMQELVNNGIPVSPANLGLSYENGVLNNDFTPSLDNMRGVDISDLWEAQLDVKDKLRNNLKSIHSRVSPVND